MSGHQSQRAMLKAEKRELTKQIKELTKKMTGVERMLAKLESAAAPTAGKSRKPANDRQQTQRSQKQTNQKTGGLPRTGGEFWMSMLGKRPRSFSDVVTRAEAAIAKSTKKDLTEDDKRKLNLRARVAIKLLADSRAISSEGAGRARRYSATA